MPIFDHTPGKDHIEERLQSDLVAWLATVRPDGRPHVVPIWFLWEGETVFIVSKPGNQKIKNITNNPRVTIALDDSKTGNDAIVFDGIATLIPQPSADSVPPAYFEKYRNLLREMEWPEADMIAEFSQAIGVQITKFLTF